MRAVGVAVLASVALVVAYLTLGGASYAPAKVADPCVRRDWREPKGLEEVAEQIVLSGLDGAACELGTSREDVVLAFESRARLRRFARQHGIDDAEFAQIVRAGLLRSIDDAQRAGALGSTSAGNLRALVRRLPVDALVELSDLLSASF